MSFLLSFLKFAVIGYLALIVLLYVSQRQLLYYPPGDPGLPAARGIPEAQVITVTTADGLQLKSWYVPPRDAGKPVLVQFHGNASWLAGRVDFSRIFIELGYGVLITSYRGYSGNPGRPSEQGIYADARANLEWLTAQGQRFVLVGESLGSGVAVQMATEYKAHGVLLESPYTSIAATAQYHYPFVPAYWLVRDRYDSLSKITRINAPLLVVQGTADTVVPTTLGRELFAAANEPKQAVWVEGGGHNDFYTPAAMAEVKAWLAAL